MPEEPLSRSAVVGGATAIVVVITLLVVGLVAGRSTGSDTETGAAGGESARAGDVREVLAPTTATTDAHTSATQDHEQVTAPTDAAGIVVPVPTEHAHTTDASTPAPASATVTAPIRPASPATTVPGATTVTTVATTIRPPTTQTTLPTGPIISVNDPRLTAAQRAAAIDLIDRTTAAMHAFPNEAAVTAAGYTSIGDAATGFEHFVNWGYLTDSNEVDPNRIESIVLRVSGGVKTVESAMYILSLGKGMGDAPDIAGPLTKWHDHTNLCFAGNRVVGLAGPDGTCAEGTLLVTPPMLHVWITPQPCGPFAGIETSGHGTGCH